MQPLHEALDLDERRAALDASGPVSARLARRRLVRWREGLGDRHDYDAWLRTEAMTTREFLRVLGTTTDTAPRRSTDWMREAERILDAPAAGMLGPWLREQPAGPLQFLRLVEPFFDDAVRRISAAVPARELGIAIRPETLLARLQDLVVQVAVVELHIRRHERTLVGDTPEARLGSYLDELAEPGGRARLLGEYPVLVRRLVRCVDQWVGAQAETCERLNRDLARLQATFGVSRPTGLESGLGDSHRGGRTVSVVTFDDGRRVVYKPRSLAVDVHFHGLLRWIDARGGGFGFRTPRVVPGGDYGWVEYVSWQPCGDRAEADRFHERLGGLLGLTWILDGTDLHHENLVASGEHPVLIDLETLFQPDIHRLGREAVGLRDLEASVMRTGLLPERAWASEGSGGVDLSGIGGREGQALPGSVPTLDGDPTDALRFEAGQAVLDRQRHRPSLGDEPLEAVDHLQPLCRGLERMLGFVRRERRALLAPDGPLATFVSDEVRFLLRNTRTYQLVQRSLSHPHALRNGLEATRLADRLWRAVRHRPELAPLVAYERRSLLDGDVPGFWGTPDSCSLRTAEGEVHDGFFGESPLDRVRGRIRRLGDDTIQRQVWYVGASISTVAPASTPRRVPSTPLPPDACAAAGMIADRILGAAAHGGGRMEWIGVVNLADGAGTVAPVGADLYGGAAGIALFLGYAAHHLDRADCGEAARVALSTAIAQDANPEDGIGAFEGRGSLAYALVHLGRLWNEPALLEQADANLQDSASRLDDEAGFDVVGGSAGLLMTALARHAGGGSDLAWDVARRAADHLLAHAQPCADGLSWPQSEGGVPLAGYSHGAAGIAAALTRFTRAGGGRRYLDAARRAADWERGLFDPEAGNWIDRRADGSASPVDMDAWCHGAAGIALARAEMLSVAPSGALERDLGRAMARILRDGFERGTSLCHGGLGNAEILDAVAESHPRWRGHVGRARQAILGGLARGMWCGTPLAVEVPGLMTGMAGTGLALLRWADPTIPQVLRVDPPR